jgi:hypothetical protein
MKRSKASVPFGQLESIMLCLFDGTIDELGAGVAGRSATASAGTAATAAIAIPAAAEANKHV